MELAYKENTKGYKVLTPDGYKSFAGIRRLGQRIIYHIKFNNGFWLECTDNHKLFITNNIKTPVNRLSVGDVVLSKSGPVNVLSITNTGKTQLVYDLVEVDNGHRYYTNGILSSNCEFIIDEETLIAPTTLIDLVGDLEPLYKTGQVRWYKKPEPNKIYVVGLDPSLGTGGDAAAIQVFEANSTIQIAEWRHNRTPIPEQVRVLTGICHHINECIKDPHSIYYSVENNTIGEAVLISIAELGEDKIQGYFLSESGTAGNGRRFRKGFNTTNRSKLAACSKLKNLIESKRMHIHSKGLVSELKTFIAAGTSFAAKIGETDDLVMATVLTVRMMQQLQMYHRELDGHLKDHIDHVIEPMPFFALLG